MRDKRPKRKNKLTCFVSAAITADLGVIKEVLLEKGIEYRALYELVAPGLTIFDKLTESISKADLFIAVLDSVIPNANVAFELGYAFALKKPVLILAPPDLKRLPANMNGMLCIRADAQNREAISFAIDQVLAAPKDTKRRKQELVKTTKPIGVQATELIRKLDSLGRQVTHVDLEQIVQTALENSGVSVVARSKEPDAAVDFAVWVDELEPIIGNPIIIEIKNRIPNSTQAVHIRNQMFDYLSSSNSPSALVLYLEGEIYDATHQSLSLPHIYFVKIRDFLTKLESKSFGDTVRDMRNAIVHGRNA